MGLLGFLLGGPRRCTLHGVALLRGAVPVRQGRQSLAPEQVEAMRRGFPNANSFAARCLTGPDLRDTAIVEYCPACRAAEQAWLDARTEVPGG